ncbi:hypothetical protein GCM10023149_43510 [Mucilaginibacter gynuensis]|uniref:Helix-turn-helix type 11 domain-containing protein n=1 Tax=Mucilaginibacter gynuensis TaxID=1302236 RepID=A0ABP8H809_9SPHI
MPKYYFDRLEYLSFLIQRKSTGTPEKLAVKLSISERTVYDYVEILRSLGAEIKYNKVKGTYYYVQAGHFDFKFKRENQLSLSK